MQIVDYSAHFQEQPSEVRNGPQNRLKKNRHNTNKRYISVLQRKWLIITLVLLPILILTGLIFIGAFHPTPPVQSIALGRRALHRAQKVGAESYAPQFFFKAQQTWFSTMHLWSQENQKWFFNRDFSRVQELALQTCAQATQAEQRATKYRDSLKQVLKIGSVLLQQKITDFKGQYRSVPIQSAVLTRFTRGEMLLLESNAAFERENYLVAFKKFRDAEQILGQVGKQVDAMVTDYLTDVPQWKKWAEETIYWSKNHNAIALVIDKFAHRLYVYKDGKVSAEFPVELGANWLGHKRQRGDRATPEGIYTIRKKKSTNQTKYHKALEIDYPNNRDKDLFSEAKKRGWLPANAHIGGLIEIHGDGGRGVDWTEGCIALENKEIDQVFKMVSVGTPVTIVGSLNHKNGTQKRN